MVVIANGILLGIFSHELISYSVDHHRFPVAHFVITSWDEPNTFFPRNWQLTCDQWWQSMVTSTMWATIFSPPRLFRFSAWCPAQPGLQNIVWRLRSLQHPSLFRRIFNLQGWRGRPRPFISRNEVVIVLSLVHDSYLSSWFAVDCFEWFMYPEGSLAWRWIWGGPTQEETSSSRRWNSWAKLPQSRPRTERTDSS